MTVSGASAVRFTPFLSPIPTPWGWDADGTWEGWVEVPGDVSGGGSIAQLTVEKSELEEKVMTLEGTRLRFFGGNALVTNLFHLSVAAYIGGSLAQLHSSNGNFVLANSTQVGMNAALGHKPLYVSLAALPAGAILAGANAILILTASDNVNGNTLNLEGWGFWRYRRPGGAS